YQVTVYHTGCALAVTAGFAGATSDKTIVRYNPSVDRVKTHEAYAQMEYTLVDSEQREFSEKGAYLIVDGGALCLLLFALVLTWRCLMDPLKSALTVAELKWSKHLESLRRDVECFFGKLKGRSGS
ncbi:unnamed protein product, partial [Discosporangium mesarthrocarpum]